jgi:hypothetical protein
MGQVLEADDFIGVVGEPAENGGLFAHVHIQLLTDDDVDVLSEDCLAQAALEGYLEHAEVDPDPTELISPTQQIE